MSSGLYFLKLELNYLKDSTFNTVLTDGQKWRYIQLSMLAKELNADGSFMQHGKELSLQDIAWYLHMDADQLQADMDAIRAIGLIHENGHGPCLTRFLKEQETPRSGAERMAALRQRETSMLHISDELVTVRHTESESESESESDLKSQSQRIESVSQDPQPATDDDHSLPDRKKEICSLSGIPPRYSQVITKDPAISPDDILSELSRSYSRGNKVKNPGLITGMNLVKHELHPEWNDPAQWTRHLPAALAQKLGLVIQGEENLTNNQSLVATRIPSDNQRGEAVKKKVDAFLRGGR